ncbi:MULTISPECIES: YjdF family protein [Staphylococcus]|uniref:YjdF family protein n=1 Tax=Staphylococcus hsinchuensis TaxID=3051183 RepID=A0ABZ3EFV2_9STAP|nr:YjdF family protein [Staphylococcus sp. Marseille-Q6910]
MELNVFHDGQFFVGIVEYQSRSKSKFVKYTFGQEPNDEQILQFIDNQLLILLDKTSTLVPTKIKKQKVNPKRLQRQVAKEQQTPKNMTKAQQALKQEQELNKKESRKKRKARQEAYKTCKRQIKRHKAKQKHKGR